MKQSIKLWLFLGSYAPLFILLAILNWENSFIGMVNIYKLQVNWLPVYFVILALLGSSATIIFIKISSLLSPVSIVPKVIEPHSQDTLAYLITYLIPFIGFKFSDIPNTIANIVLFIIIGFLYVQSNMIHLNPTLSIIGYHVYKIKVDDKNKLLLAKRSVKNDTRQRVISITGGLYIESNK